MNVKKDGVKIEKDFIRDRIVLLLGAGASIEFFEPLEIEEELYSLSTKDITRFLMNLRKFYNFLYQITPQNIEIIKKGSDKDIDIDFFISAAIEVYRKIICLLKTSRLKNYNFEDIIHVTDKICTLIIDHILNRQNLASIPPDMIVCNFFGGNITYDNKIELVVKFLPYILRKYVLYFFYLFNKNMKSEGVELWKNFLLALTGKYCVSIYSLNYDLLIYEALKEITNIDFCDGFIENKQVSKLLFDQQTFFSRSHIYAPLHGSLLFDYDPSGNILIKLKSENDILSSIFRLDFYDLMEINQDKSINWNVNMITSYNKIDTMLLEPYGSYFLRFCKDIFDASKVVIIGFSGYDNHICSILRSASKACIWDKNPKKYFIVFLGNKSNRRCTDYYSDPAKADAYKRPLKEERYFYTKGTKNFLNDEKILQIILEHM